MSGSLKSLKIRSEQREDIENLLSQSDQALREILSAFEERQAPIISASVMRDLVKPYVLGSGTEHSIARQLITLAMYGQQAAVNSREVFQRLLNGVKKNPEFNKETSSRLSEIQDIFIRLLDTDSVRLSAKALFLSFNYSTILSETSITTDIRPVFDDSRDEIIGSIVTQTLLIKFSDGDDNRSISLALDSHDVDRLTEQLHAAKAKAIASKQMMDEKVGVGTFITGEETYGF